VGGWRAVTILRPRFRASQLLIVLLPYMPHVDLSYNLLQIAAESIATRGAVEQGIVPKQDLVPTFPQHMVVAAKQEKRTLRVANSADRPESDGRLRRVARKNTNGQETR
jgi:hypothetical protein